MSISVSKLWLVLSFLLRPMMTEEKFGPFARGAKNDAYAQYFIGQSYLNMLTTSGVVTANVTFEPGCATIGIFTTRADKSY